MNRATRWKPAGMILLLSLTGLVACDGAVDHGSSDARATTGAAASDVVATVAGETITLAEVDAAAKAQDMQPYQAIYDARAQALDGLIAERLLVVEATSRGISKDELIDTEIRSKIAAVTDADAESFYNENQSRMGGQPFEAMQGQIAAFLAAQRSAEAQGTFLTSLKEKSGVQVTLDPPRVEVLVAANDPAKGPYDAPVVIVEFSDFQ